ncbi:MAG: heavy-metal-associated domain-containing protein [Bacteroidetes bacterium]|nr:heavy-metal-associated domain-containing protein [Bacteroidota bacterium]
MKTWLKSTLGIAALLISFAAKAQITEVQIGVDGLTCSQCSRSVEMRIRKLSFVQDVKMNLEHTEGKVYFKSGAKVEVDKIAQAVVDAGFSVRKLKANMLFKNVAVSSNYCFAYDNNNYQFIQTPGQTLNGAVNLTFVGKGYMEKKELKKWQPYMKSNCGAGSKNYFVTIEKS